jgi:hypothetical protein
VGGVNSYEIFGIDFGHPMAVACRRQGLDLAELPFEIACDMFNIVREWYEPIEDEI